MAEIICAKCGTPNAPDDQFCGSCGAFLEWQEADADVGPASVTPPRPTDDGTPLPREPPPAPPLQAIASVPPDRPEPGSVTCVVCGTVNPAGRTFCQRCGSRLATSPADPATEPLRPTAASPEREAGGGGLPGWLPIVVGLGLIIGLVAVAASFVLGSLGDATSLATSAPASPTPTLTATLTPTGSPGPGESPAAESPSSAPPAAATGSLTLTGAVASSVVGDREMFNADKVIDGRLDTSWQEGAADEQGEWIEVTFDAATVEYLVVYSGYQLSRDAYLANRRPNEVLVSIDGGAPALFRLADSEQPQRLDLDDTAGATRIRVEIVSTYDPEATAYPGSPFDDMAISELRVFGITGG